MRNAGMTSAFVLAVLATDAAAQSSRATAVPDFSGLWERAWKQAQLFEPPENGPGPVTGDPKFPHIRGANSPWIADPTSPILQPATRDRLRVLNEQQFAGHALLDNDSVCLPVGVLAALNLFDPMQMLQTPGEVIFLYARDQQVRHVYLDRPHATSAKPSWFGDSVGHYEGDTLVVDTIGMNDRTQVDRYGTPHSTRLHTVERYRLSPQTGQLQTVVTVDDPETFTTPWTAMVAYKRQGAGKFEEIVCAENNRPTADEALKIPTAAKPDF
jgi:hypothetical protein